MRLEGTVLRGPELDPVEGRVVVADGQVTAVEETETDSDDIVVPAFVNAHTHVGDSIAKEAGAGLSLDELVAPPDGLKHRLLRQADRAETVEAIRRSLRFMVESGTAAFLEFREGGVEGVEMLRDAVEGLAVDPFVFGRGDASVIEVADGYGASGARDGEFGAARTAARKAGKPFAIHAGERDAADINPALDLDPDLLVHMVHAESLHLERVADRGTPIAVCPRSNLVTGVGLPPVEDLREATTVALGTDNVMLNSPSMFRELEMVTKACGVPARAALRMATVNGAEAVGLDCGVVAEGRPAKLFVLDGDTDNLAGYRDPHRAVARRASVADVRRVVL